MGVQAPPPAHSPFELASTSTVVRTCTSSVLIVTHNHNPQPQRQSAQVTWQDKKIKNQNLVTVSWGDYRSQTTSFFKKRQAKTGSFDYYFSMATLSNKFWGKSQCLSLVKCHSKMCKEMIRLPYWSTSNKANGTDKTEYFIWWVFQIYVSHNSIITWRDQSIAVT
jgi:hypothetical protein